MFEPWSKQRNILDFSEKMLKRWAKNLMPEHSTLVLLAAPICGALKATPIAGLVRLANLGPLFEKFLR